MDLEPLTKTDLQLALRDVERDLKQFILEREIIALRWVVGVQITYFGITLAAVWFLISRMGR